MEGGRKLHYGNLWVRDQKTSISSYGSDIKLDHKRYRGVQ
jgi:hypothetical protein